MSAKYAVTFLLLAAAAAFGAAATDVLLFRLVLANTALAFAVIAAAYSGVGPRVFGKRPDGRRAWWAWVILWPYFALNAVAFRLARATIRGPAFAEVAPNLWFGRRLTDRETRQAGVPWRAVLDLAAEFREVEPLRNVAAYRSLPVLDTMPPTLDQLCGAIAWLREQRANGPVLVHCAMGHGRTGTVVIGYLIAVGTVRDVAEGLAMLRRLRPGVGLNSRQKSALRSI